MRIRASMRTFAAEQVGNLLARVVFELHRAARSQDEDAIHDLRVSIRRFSQALRSYDGLFPPKAVKKIRRRLRGLMKTAAAVRDRDVAIGLLEKAGLPESSPLIRQLVAERKAASRKLAEQLRRWSRHNFSVRWREDLHLSTA